VILYACGQKTSTPSLHPCGKAARALTEAGYEFKIRTVGGYRLMPWTWPHRSRDRAEVKKLSGSNDVPVLVLDDGEVISGSGVIANWTRDNPAARG
jgi:glutathione S-transferase